MVKQSLLLLLDSLWELGRQELNNKPNKYINFKVYSNGKKALIKEDVVVRKWTYTGKYFNPDKVHGYPEMCAKTLKLSTWASMA